MLSPATERRIDEMIAISDELGAIVPVQGWTKYALSILARLQNLAIELDSAYDETRMDATLGELEWKVSEPKFKPANDLTEEEKAQGYYFRNVNGDNIKFNAETGEPMDGQPKAFGVDSLQEMINNARANVEARKEREAALQRKGSMTCEEKVAFENEGEVTKDSRGRDVTHFNHDEDTMNVTDEMIVKDADGNEYRILAGSIEHLTIFASENVGRGLDAAAGLSVQVGGSPESWKHSKGVGKVLCADGEVREADLHWFESKECGQLEWKVKQLVEDMDESQIYW